MTHETWRQRDDKRWHDKRGPIPRPRVMTWHNITQHDMRGHDMTKQNMTREEMTRQDITWREIPDMTSHDTVRPDTREMTWHGARRHDTTGHDATGHDPSYISSCRKSNSYFIESFWNSYRNAYFQSNSYSNPIGIIFRIRILLKPYRNYNLKSKSY